MLSMRMHYLREDCEVPLHEQIRQERAALCGIGMVPLITDESAQRCAEVNDVAPKVTDFGAQPDGSTDCTSAFQVAFDYAAKIDTHVEIPGGTYRIDGRSGCAEVAVTSQADYDRLLESYHVANRLARELKVALDAARQETTDLATRCADLENDNSNCEQHVNLGCSRRCAPSAITGGIATRADGGIPEQVAAGHSAGCV